MSAASKQKGAGFERSVCRRLSLWVTEGERQDCFWRSAMSGGRATLGLARGEDLARQAGDISAVSPEGHALTERFYIELKFYRDLSIARSLLEGRGALAQFWATTQKQAALHGRQPMLIAKQNLYPELVLVASGSIKYHAPTLASAAFDVYLLANLLSRPFQKFEATHRRKRAGGSRHEL